MTQLLLSQYTIKKNDNPNNNHDKKGDINRKDDDARIEDKDDDTGATAGAHVGETTSDKDTIVVPSHSSSIGALVSDVIKLIVSLT